MCVPVRRRPVVVGVADEVSGVLLACTRSIPPPGRGATITPPAPPRGTWDICLAPAPAGRRSLRRPLRCLVSLSLLRVLRGVINANANAAGAYADAALGSSVTPRASVKKKCPPSAHFNTRTQKRKQSQGGTTNNGPERETYVVLIPQAIPHGEIVNPTQGGAVAIHGETRAQRRLKRHALTSRARASCGGSVVTFRCGLRHCFRSSLSVSVRRKASLSITTCTTSSMPVPGELCKMGHCRP